MKPTRLLDPRFKYVHSSLTTPERLRKKFARIIREQAQSDAEKQKATVTQIKRREKA